MSCPDCEKAQTVRHWSGFHGGCRGCQVRALASGPTYHDAMRANALTPRYRTALQNLFGEDWRQVHEDVKAEAVRLKKMNEIDAKSFTSNGSTLGKQE